MKKREDPKQRAEEDSGRKEGERDRSPISSAGTSSETKRARPTQDAEISPSEGSSSGRCRPENSSLKSWVRSTQPTVTAMETIDVNALQWRKLAAEGLDCDYCVLLPRALADQLLHRLERELEYFSGKLTRVFVYGKWHDIPRQQVSFGEEGLSYTFSGATVPARPWPPALMPLRELVSRVAGIDFNFVLVNRYRNGSDHMGEHRDDEDDLDRAAPIASVSLGQKRLFAFRHCDARRPANHPQRRTVPPVKIDLEHGSLLMMNHPTNSFWYHSLPPRKSCPGVRINLTFRKMVNKHK